MVKATTEIELVPLREVLSKQTFQSLMNVFSVFKKIITEYEEILKFEEKYNVHSVYFD